MWHGGLSLYLWVLLSFTYVQLCCLINCSMRINFVTKRLFTIPLNISLIFQSTERHSRKHSVFENHWNSCAQGQPIRFNFRLLMLGNFQSPNFQILPANFNCISFSLPSDVWCERIRASKGNLTNRLKVVAVTFQQVKNIWTLFI